MGRLSANLQAMRNLVTNLRAKISKKDNKINDCQISIDFLELKLAKRNEEIIKKDQDIVQITGTLQSIQQQKHEAENWLNRLVRERDDIH